MSKNRPANTTTSTATPGMFVLGRNAFAKVSAVEKIRPSVRLQDDLRRLRNAAPEVRRAELTATYGKR